MQIARKFSKTALFVLLLLTALVQTNLASAEVKVPARKLKLSSLQWHCSSVQKTNLYKAAVSWQTLSCTWNNEDKPIGPPQRVNLVYIDLTNSDIKVVPLRAYDPVTQNDSLAILPKIAQQYSDQYNLIAGINGGYFYRNDISDFYDNICLNNNFFPPIPAEGLGDSLLQYHGKSYATNCAFIPGGKYLDHARSVLVLSRDAKTGRLSPNIQLVKPYKIYYSLDRNGNKVIPDAIGAGPALVKNGQLADDGIHEDLLPTFESAANTAVGIIKDAKGKPVHLVLFTVDGNDKSSYRLGMVSYEVANFLLNYVHVSDAMGMDQGGSTTMYIQKSDPEKYPYYVVSDSDAQPGSNKVSGNIRNIYNGLFVGILKQ